MENNRNKWLAVLGVLAGLCFATVLCMVMVGGVYFWDQAEDDGGTALEAIEQGQGEGADGGGASDGAGTSGGTDGSTSQSQSTTKGSNTFSLRGSDPPTLDPALASDATSANYIVEIFSGLVTLDTELNIQPDIAESWEKSEDGTLYTFHLREDVTFADGRPVTAEDFKYSIERTCDPETQSTVADTYLGDIVGCRAKLRGQAEEVAGVRPVDEHTLEIEIDAPKVYFLAKLTYPTAFVVDRETIEREGRLWATTSPNGTGPFKLESYNFGESLVLVPNENYYGEPKPSVDRVTYQLAGGNPVTLYEQDQVDIAGVGLADLQRVTDPSSPLSDEVHEVASLSLGYLGLNADQAPFDDPLVRQAFNMAVDKEQLTESVLEGTVDPAYGILPPGMPGHNPDLEGLRYDPERARELLAESSYGGPEGLPPITLHTAGGGGSGGATNEAIIEMWRRNLDVEVSIEQAEWGTFLADVSRKPNPYQLFSVGWIADYPDPQNFLDILFHCESQDNKTGYCNSEVDQLLEEARVEQDEERRIELYREAEQIIVNDGAWIPLWFNKGHVLIKPWVENYPLTPTIVPILKYLEINQ